MKTRFLIFLLPLLSACTHSNIAQNLPYLKGKNTNQIESTFGRPVVVHKEDNSTLWSYYQNNCSSLIFFDTNDIVQYAELRGKCSKNLAQK